MSIHSNLTGRLAIVLGLVAVLAFAASASAQSGRPLAAMDDAFSPDFHRRDLGTFVETLDLDQAQADAVETLYVDYQTAFGAGAKDVRTKIAAIRPGAEADQTRALDAQRQIRERTRELMEEVRNKTAATDDPEERRTLMHEYQTRVREIVDELQVEWRSAEGTPANEAIIAQIQEIVRVWQRERDQLRVLFVTSTMLVLRDEQFARWPTLERRLRREKTLVRGQLTGETTDLLRVVQAVRLDAESAALVAPVLASYEERLDGVLAERNRLVSETRDALSEAIDTNDVRGGLRIVDRLLAGHRAVRDVNEEYAQLIASALPEDIGAKFTAAYRLRGYPRVYQPTPTERIMRRAAAMGVLDDDTRAAVETLQAEYLARLAPFNDTLRVTILINEPAQKRYRLEARLHDVEPAVDPIRVALDRRRELGQSYVDRLRMLLPEGIAGSMALPGRPRDGGRQRPGESSRASQRDGAAPDRSAEILRRFDSDGDGRLDASEMDEAAKTLRAESERDGG